ncbi:effector-binding domain-containing protein [Kribbella voronezhensis]|uniref:Effector-binding domain-containing protein n=1 Tax=Kribbella voronezhensis TaxID=2512212 RepID=A0A4R7SYF1_9ACTN|nr:GyrI-like domain-containing protein [Kribbella voronezhensis]TDU83756.1 effector-binding domain-containing protein [Kribbella voronezhensis]
MNTEYPQHRVVTEQPTAVRRATLHQSELAGWFAAAYGEIAGYLGRHGLTAQGYPFARYHLRSDGRFDVEAGFPVEAGIAGDGSVQPSSLPGGHVVTAWHTGPYQEVGQTYALLAGWIAEHGVEQAGDAWEIYHDPPTGSPALWRTEVIQPFTPAQVDA